MTLGNPIPTPLPPGDYVLGTGDDEFERLGFQHRVWLPTAEAHWQRAGFGLGMRLLDAGCGPGYASQALAEIAGPQGHIIAADASERFIGHAAARPRAPGAAPIETRLADLRELDLPPESLDGAYARWVFCFMAEPERALARIVRALRPGGVLAIQDYLAYAGIRMVPPRPIFTRVFQAVAASWGGAGGDPEAGTRLTEMLARLDMEIREFVPLQLAARPGSLLWRWPETFFYNYLPRLVEMGFLTAADVTAWHAQWAVHSLDPAAFFITPPQVTMLAIKR